MGLGKVLINRNGAYGDMIHMSHLPRLLKDQGWDYVGIFTGYKGVRILKNNPFIDEFHYFEFEGEGVTREFYNAQVRNLSLQYDKTVDLLHTLEIGALTIERQNEYYMHQSVREKMGKENYYDISTIASGYPHLVGKYRGEMFFDEAETKIVEHDLLRPGRFKDNFKVIVNLSGSGAHKYFIQAREVVEWILNTYQDSVVFLTGGKELEQDDFSDQCDRIRSLVGKKPFRQVANMMKYMDCAIGCESGIMCAASMWDIPTIQLMTCASVYNHCKYTTKDYSLQSPARCSPCHKCPYRHYGCPKKDNYPLCVYFNVDDIKTQIKKVYENEYSVRKNS